MSDNEPKKIVCDPRLTIEWIPESRREKPTKETPKDDK